MGQRFPEFQEQRKTLRGMPKFSEISYRELPTFLPQFPKFPVEWFAFRKFYNFRIAGDFRFEFFRNLI